MNPVVQPWASGEADSHQNSSYEKSIEPEFSRESPIVKSSQEDFRDFSPVFVLFVGIFGLGWSLYFCGFFFFEGAGYASLVSQTVNNQSGLGQNYRKGERMLMPCGRDMHKLFWGTHPGQRMGW